MVQATMGEDEGVSDPAEDAGREKAAILDHLAELRVLGRRQAMTLKDGRNQVAMLQRETARSRSAMEQFLAVTLAGLTETRAALLASEAERAALSDRLRVLSERNRRLTTRGVALAAELRAKAAEADEARSERSATLADAHFQIRTLMARIGDLEKRLAEAEVRDRAGHAHVAEAKGLFVRQAETEAALAEALRRADDIRAERSRSRWISLGRALGLTKL